MTCAASDRCSPGSDFTIARQSWDKKISGRLAVGEDYSRSGSRGPELAHLVAVILSKLSTRVRANLLRSIPEQFAAAGQLPEVDELLLDAAASFLKRLRSKTSQTCRGPVTVEDPTIT